MSDYTISRIYPSDKRGIQKAEELLIQEGIRLDGNLDYTCGMYDDNYNLIATGSCFKNTLRCMAVSSEHQGEGLMNEIVTHLINIQFERGNTHLFLYTKCTSAKFFGDLGFYEIARIDGELVFMENDRTGFQNYLLNLKKETGTAAEGKQRIAAIVMNANPFTLGHRYLVEKAAQENDLVHLFAVSEDASLVPYSVRKELIRKGTADLSNVMIHDSGPYIISSATFPSYFQKDAEAVIRGHALLDLTIFSRIAEALDIQRRYVGEEPKSLVTGIYNEIMQTQLPEHGVECIVIPRLSLESEAVSASTVREALQSGDMETFRRLVPASTYNYFTSAEAEPVLEAIRAAGNVVHY